MESHITHSITNSNSIRNTVTHPFTNTLPYTLTDPLADTIKYSFCNAVTHPVSYIITGTHYAFTILLADTLTSTEHNSITNPFHNNHLLSNTCTNNQTAHYHNTSTDYHHSSNSNNNNFVALNTVSFSNFGLDSYTKAKYTAANTGTPNGCSRCTSYCQLLCTNSNLPIHKHSCTF
eukprot:PhF_6_TR1980/c1_g1_i2/m.3304